MVLRGERHVIVSENVNRGYWTGGHYPAAWTPVSVFKRYDPEPRGCDPKLWMALMRQPVDRGDRVGLGAIA